MHCILSGLPGNESGTGQGHFYDAAIRQHDRIRTSRLDDRRTRCHRFVRVDLFGLRLNGYAPRSPDYRGNRKHAHRNSNASHRDVMRFGATVSVVFASSRLIMCISSTTSDKVLALFGRRTTKL
jgi:hypothetical protein